MIDSSSRPGRSPPGLSRRDLLTGAVAGVLAAPAAATAFPAEAHAQAPAQGKPNRKLLLGGGGIKGAYQAGVVKALLEQGFVPNVIYGVSVGGLNAAFLVDRASFLGKPRREYHAALGQPATADAEPAKPVDWPFIGAELVRFWMENITGSDKIMRKKRTAYLAALFRRFNGLYDPAPLRGLINRHLDLQRIRAAGIPVSVFAINVDTWQGDYFDEEQDNFLEAILGSAAIPVVFPIVELVRRDGQRFPYVDGGLRENVPVAIALAGLGDKKPTHLVSIVCQSERQPRQHLERGHLVHLLQRHADIAGEQMLKRDTRLLDEAREKHGIESLILRPDEAVAYDPATGKPFEMDDFKPEHIAYLTRQGYADGTEQLTAAGIRFAARGFR